MSTDINKFMLLALEMAKEAYDDGEVPVGAVVTRNGEVIATGRNRREKAKNALLHAAEGFTLGVCPRAAY